jgi:putative ATP-binding cassette transporter
MIGELIRRSRRRLTLAVALGLVAGIAGAGLIAIVGRAEHDVARAFGGHASTIFAIALAVRLAAAFVSRVLLVQTGQDFVLQLRTSLAERVLSSDLLAVERVGAARVTAALTGDVTAVATFFASVPTVCVSAAVVIGSLVFIAILSGKLLLLTLLVIGLGVAVYRPLSHYGTRRFAAARQTENALFAHFAQLTRGFKELKMDRAKSAAFLEPLLKDTVAEYRRENVAALNAYALVDVWTGFVFFLALGAALFPGLSPVMSSPAQAAAYVLAMMFLVGPLHAVVGLLPVASSALVSVRALQALSNGLLVRADVAGVAAERPMLPLLQSGGWRRLDLEGIQFSYEAEEAFGVGPLDFQLNPGEIVFVTGGNGSGKSTFVKVLSGLYLPHGGRLCLDGVPVDASRWPSYRASFSAIFSDFCLFPELPVATSPALERRARGYLKQLRLDHLVTIENGRFSRMDLSTGQRRRLAMVAALLEDRPLLLLDEWAAEQDAETRAFFYEELLPSLRDRGTTVVAVTHDERFFDCADRLVRFEYGMISQVQLRAAVPKSERSTAFVSGIRPNT